MLKGFSPIKIKIEIKIKIRSGMTLNTTKLFVALNISISIWSHKFKITNAFGAKKKYSSDN